MTPDAHTIKELRLDVGDGHELYVQDWGNKEAELPIIFLHGGPGSGTHDGYKQTFIPEKQRVIFFDQRGSGLSTPFGNLAHNTTDDLIEDIEKIAKKLKLNKFILNGGSWGSALALAYGIKYPERIAAMTLRGIFTGAQTEIDWLDEGGYKAFFPDAWESFVASVPEDFKTDPSGYHLGRIFGPDEASSKESAYHYSRLEGSVLRLDDRYTPYPFDEFDPTGTKIELHYMTNRCFMPDNYILDNAHKLTMPIWLIQGRYDMICPPRTAHELNKRLPKSKLIWVIAGHGNERSLYDVNRTILLQLTT